MIEREPHAPTAVGTGIYLPGNAVRGRDAHSQRPRGTCDLAFTHFGRRIFYANRAARSTA